MMESNASLLRMTCGMLVLTEGSVSGICGLVTVLYVMGFLYPCTQK